MKKWTWLIGLSLVLLSFLAVMEKGADYFGKSYTDTEEFRSEFSRFTEGLLLFELAPPKIRADQSVASWEIDEYRMNTGSLADQIQAVRDQYGDAITAADESGDSDLVEELEEQRTEELTAVRERFSDDEAAKKAILSQREAQREETLRQLASQKAQFTDETSGYAYRLRDLNSGEEFSAGILVEQPYFEQSYSAQDPLYSSDEYWHYSFTEDGALASSSEHRFSGVIQFPDKTAAAEFTSGSGQFQFIKVLLYLFLLIAAAGAVWMFKRRPIRMEWYTSMKEFEKWRRLPFEWKLFAFIMTGLLAWASGNRFWAILSGPWYEADFGFLLRVLSAAALALVFIAFGILQAIWLWKHFGNRRTFIEEMRESFSSQQLHAASDAFLERSIGFQMTWVLGVMFLWGAGTVLMILQPVLVIVWLPATVLIGLPSLLFLMTRFGYLNRLLRGTQQLAEGHFGAQLAVKGKSPLARHAKHLNHLREGYQQSVSERSKSERLKTELITNVSHDLRTPLTSIITYTDLLKNEDLAPEERRKYVDILDRKSERLKVLIEDLFEVSKMASGNAEITKQRLDIGQLVAQALAEHEEALKDAALDVRVAAQEQPIYASVDGQKWWRLLDNLILNATKYSLPGSRVYIGLEEQQGELAMTVKNVTRYELGDSTEELLERFKRGDTSRQTEGSGLGLAIAQSIVDLHGGKMTLEVDGDLFKVTVTLPSS